MHAELVKRGVTPDLVTDQTSAHDPLNGYIPQGLTLEQAAALRTSDPKRYWSDEVQKLTDSYIKRIDESLVEKEKEIKQV